MSFCHLRPTFLPLPSQIPSLLVMGYASSRKQKQALRKNALAARNARQAITRQSLSTTRPSSSNPSSRDPPSHAQSLSHGLHPSTQIPTTSLRSTLSSLTLAIARFEQCQERTRDSPQSASSGDFVYERVHAALSFARACANQVCARIQSSYTAVRLDAD